MANTEAFLDALPLIWDFVTSMMMQCWIMWVGSSLLSAFLALIILDRLFHIFDILRR